MIDKLYGRIDGSVESLLHLLCYFLTCRGFAGWAFMQLDPGPRDDDVGWETGSRHFERRGYC